ncbi:MAG: BatA and WFA domain-containing protein [Flavobacteriaceae bacterium]|jgi:hypothetical protein|nr:BatA and WFA domain-containing protein [Flavobacteriaceae bacterium]
MYFKHPEILYFLFLLIIPILVHLFQLRRFKKEWFTNVKFLKELSIQTRKSSKIKKWLLLFTRLLLLTCLIIAFAQPYFKGKDNLNKDNELFIILDNSFSMQTKGQKGELLKRSVQELLENIPENQDFSLYTNNDSYLNTNIKLIQKELQNIDYSNNSFNLNRIITEIQSRKKTANQDVIIITDGIGLEPSDFKDIDKENTYFVIQKAEQRFNISIDSVYGLEVSDNFYEISVRLKSFGKTENEIPIAVYNRDNLIAKTQIIFDTSEKTLNFTLPKENIQGKIAIEDNSISYDNEYFFSISQPEKTNIISIGESSKSEFLYKIFTEDEFVYSNHELSSLDYNLLQNQDAVIINELIEIPTALQVTLKDFSEKGGQVIFIPSIGGQTDSYKKFLLQFGSFKLDESNQKDRLITKISYDHPLYKGVFEKRTDNFQYPKTVESFQIQSPYPVVLAYEDHSAFLTSVSVNDGNLYFFAASIDKKNTNFQNSPLIVPTFLKMVQNQYATGIKNIILGQQNSYISNISLGKDEIVTVSNQRINFIPNQQAMGQKVKLFWQENPEESGNYDIKKNEEVLDFISFNYSRNESNLSLFNTSVFEEYNTLNSFEQVFENIIKDRTENQIWKWFVVLSLLFIILEILIQKFIK